MASSAGNAVTSSMLSGGMCPLATDPMDRIEPVGEGGRAWLQDDGGIDLVDLAGLESCDPAPSLAPGDDRWLEFLPAPRRQHDVWVSPDNLGVVGDDPALGQGLGGVIPEHVDASG